MTWITRFALSLAALLFGLRAFAAPPVPGQSDPATTPESLDVDAIKQRYWARGEETELGVVQNRLYSKAGKFQFGLLGGVISSDPFLNITALGGTFGYHFSEYFGLNFIWMRTLVSPSSALRTFEENRGATANTNNPEWYAGGELTGSLLYGKLSLIGKAIIYYDMHLSAGAGATKTESGTYLTPSLGIGQRFYINRFTSIRIDYRMLYYKETILEKEIPTKLGQPVGTRDNFNNTITLGVDFIFSIF